LFLAKHDAHSREQSSTCPEIRTQPMSIRKVKTHVFLKVSCETKFLNSMIFIGFTWIYKEFNDFQWISMDLEVECSTTSCRIYKNSMIFIGFPWIYGEFDDFQWAHFRQQSSTCPEISTQPMSIRKVKTRVFLKVSCETKFLNSIIR